MKQMNKDNFKLPQIWVLLYFKLENSNIVVNFAG